ncbi:MAG: hypothetical protein ABGW95_03655, partial [Candidatus Poseidoniia archaeon]
MKYFAQASSLTASLLLCSTGTAQLSNDDCAGAINLVVGAPAVFDTTLATNSPEVWPCGGGMLDIWYTFTAPNDAWYYFTTCGSGYDTTLEVLSGNCGALASVECNDDACGVNGWRSRLVSVDLSGGVEIHLEDVVDDDLAEIGRHQRDERRGQQHRKDERGAA